MKSLVDKSTFWTLVKEYADSVILMDKTVLKEGTPEEVAACEASYTGQYLKKVLEQ